MNQHDIETKQPLTVTCPALFLAAPASGQGKTTITAALARYFKNQGKRVCVFKTGPDYLDPQILEQASGRAVEQLDLWMAGENYCRQMLFDAASNSDLILIEGVMGLYDGTPSSADLAALFGIPIALIMDVKGMAQTAAAVIHGLASYRDDIDVVGFIANKCGSQRHSELIQEGLPHNIKLLATLPRDENISLPERHLGLVQANEVQAELEERFNYCAQALADGGISSRDNNDFFDAFLPTEFSRPESENNAEFENNAESEAAPKLVGKRIAIAKDGAFSFIYAANVKMLTKQGAQCVYFSPLHDAEVPQADALWLPGGYPELHASALANNTPLLNSIRDFFEADKPILAECGGFLYCLETLTDLNDGTYNMLGLLQGEASMRGKSGCQGMQTALLPEGDIRAHAHHRSRCSTNLTPLTHGKRQRHPAPGEGIYRERGLTASYLHLFFPSNPQAITDLFLGQ